MKYPFRVGEKYFTPAEEKHIREFLEKEPIPKDVWTNAQGESRKVVRVDFPEGTVRPGLTVYATDKENVKWFHTPSATVPGRKARIIYVVGDGKQQMCDSAEWLEWAASGHEVAEYKPAELTEAEKEHQKALIGMLARNTKPAGEEPSKWQPAKKKSQK